MVEKKNQRRFAHELNAVWVLQTEPPKLELVKTSVFAADDIFGEDGYISLDSTHKGSRGDHWLDVCDIQLRFASNPPSIWYFAIQQLCCTYS